MIEIDISGIEGVQRMLETMPGELSNAFYRGAYESAQEILQTQGLQEYPPETIANDPTQPRWYERGYGPRWRGGRGGSKTSEVLGKQFYTEQRGDWEVAVGNRAKYAPFVVGLDQTGALANIGWRRLQDVAEEKIGTIERIVTQWVERAVERMNR